MSFSAADFAHQSLQAANPYTKTLINAQLQDSLNKITIPYLKYSNLSL
jgi:hypothetical protein